MQCATTHISCVSNSVLLSLVAAKGESEPERKETRSKVDEDRKHEYPWQCMIIAFCCFFLLKSNLRTGGKGREVN